MLASILQSLEESAPAEFIGGALWLYPAVEVLHILGFVSLVGAAFVLDLRLLGGFRRLPIVPTIQGLSRWARWSLILVVPSGFLLFIVDATALAANGAYQIKMVLFVAALANAALFHRFTFRGVETGSAPGWEGDSPQPLRARLAGILSIALWVSVIASGRLIAYI